MIENMASATVYSFILLSLFAGLESALFGPLHASCRAEWTFSADCSQVQSSLVMQIKKWTGPENCDNGGEKCLYTLTSASSTKITAKHETPKKHYTDDVSFSFEENSSNGCTVKGYSTSETWYAHLDFSTNYCNMRNLIDGSNLNKDPGFTEKADDSKCTQYSSANCEKY